MQIERVLAIVTSLNGHIEEIQQAARRGQRTRRQREAMEKMQDARTLLMADIKAAQNTAQEATQ